MLAVARAVTAGWWQGPLLASLCFQLPLLQWLAMAIIALVTLRGGLQHAALTLLAVSVTALVAMQSQTVMPLIGLLAAVILVAAAQVLRVTRRLEWAWVSAAIGTAMIFTGLVVFYPVVFEQYQAVLDQVLVVWLDSLPESEAALLKESMAMGEGTVNAVSVQLLALSTMLSVGIGLTLGRYWQAALFNPGGFGAEMRSFRLEPSLACLLLAFWLIAQSGSSLWSGLSQVLWLPFMVGGIGCFHWFASSRKLPGFSYVAFYIVLLMIQVVVVLFAVIDSFFDVRKRMADGAQK